MTAANDPNITVRTGSLSLPASEAPVSPRFEEIGQLMVELVKGLPAKPVLHAPIDDAGRMTAYLGERVGCVHGVGENMENLELVGRLIGRARLGNIVLGQGRLDDLGLASDTFGGVLCADRLSHVRRPDLVLKELLRVCAPGGFVVAEFIAPQDYMRSSPLLVPDGKGFVDPSTGRYYRFMDRMRLEGMLEKAGFRAGKFEITEMNWDGDIPPGTEDVLSRRHSFVAVARKGGSSFS